MGGPGAEQAVESDVFVKLASDLEQLDVETAGGRIGNAVLEAFAANDTEQTDTDVVLVMERPELETPPDSLTARVDRSSVVVPAGRPVSDSGGG